MTDARCTRIEAAQRLPERCQHGSPSLEHEQRRTLPTQTPKAVSQVKGWVLLSPTRCRPPLMRRRRERPADPPGDGSRRQRPEEGIRPFNIAGCACPSVLSSRATDRSGASCWTLSDAARRHPPGKGVCFPATRACGFRIAARSGDLS